MSDFVRHNAQLQIFNAETSWVILSDIEKSIKAKIERIGTPLKEWNINIYRGILTGCNEAFIIDEAKRNEILSNCATKDERMRTDELIRPILRGKDIKRYFYEWAQQYVIGTFPSRHYNIENFPSVKDYLIKAEWRNGLPDKDDFKNLRDDGYGRQKLEQNGKTHILDGITFNSRKRTNNKWFETQDQIGYWEDFSKPKIVWGEISDKTKFALDENNGVFAEATTFIMTGMHLPYLVCYLNSSLSEYLFSKIGTTTGVGTVRWKKYTIERLTVPRITPQDEKIFIQLFISIKQGTKTEADINRHIYAFCGLSQDEIAFIENYSASI